MKIKNTDTVEQLELNGEEVILKKRKTTTTGEDAIFEN